jgi:hypothetical protein
MAYSPTLYTQSCPLCEETFRASNPKELLEFILVHLETADHPNGSVAKALNEAAYQINRMENN